mmetsp:Transcript_15156/g.17427  ORF Transcript_15156/g.17427 Transcript_15156/m.17427 type:complete len:119 (+) Transcript_15156:496-852(+)
MNGNRKDWLILTVFKGHLEAPYKGHLVRAFEVSLQQLRNLMRKQLTRKALRTAFYERTAPCLSVSSCLSFLRKKRILADDMFQNFDSMLEDQEMAIVIPSQLHQLNRDSDITYICCFT